MKTKHKVIYDNSINMIEVANNSIDLIVTSPPYPMIEMWDELFSKQNKIIKIDLKSNNPNVAFSLMHKILNQTWNECYRVLKNGGIACINIGDATRNINGEFKLYQNHARIISHMIDLDFSALPTILWRKQTNSPNKFMGSGMLPPGAYVTLEHEHILIFRKGNKREFKTEQEKKLRQESAYFWEERNNWFSDIWTDLKGTTQDLVYKNKNRERSAAYPFELVYRLINMFSLKTDTILDPFMGTGTSMSAAMVTGRNSIGFEIDESFNELIKNRMNGILNLSNNIINNRLERHKQFIKEKIEKNYDFKYVNKKYNFPVMTNQERELYFNKIIDTNIIEDQISGIDCEIKYDI